MRDANGKWIGQGLGDTGPTVKLIQHRLIRAFPKNSQAVALGVTESGTYDQATADAVKNIQPFLKLPATGIANYATQVALGAATPPPPPPPAYRPIHIYSAPGSGAPWWVGPAFELGEWCKSVLHLNHRPVNFPIGGYMGLIGGDPGLSYNEVIAAEGASLEWLLDNNPDVQKAMVARRANPTAVVDVELWTAAYSQSADGMEDALVRLFGDGGKYALIRDRINGVIQFGNPSKRTTGIARKVRPDWLYALVHNLNHPNDFYAEAPDEIRPVFYAEIVQANTSLPFFAHVLKVALPIISGLPFFGPLLAPMLAPFNPLMGLVSGPDEPVDAKLVALLSAQGVLTHIPDLIQLISALPGIQAHGDFEPLVPAARDIVANFRR
jgi:hypothetical protein